MKLTLVATEVQILQSTKKSRCDNYIIRHFEGTISCK